MKFWILIFFFFSDILFYYFQTNKHELKNHKHKKKTKWNQSFFKYRDSQDTIVYIHGGLQTGKAIQQIFQALEIGKKVRIIAPTVPGYGKSSGYVGRKLVEFGQDVEELVNHLKIDKFHVVGVSLGGPHSTSIVYKLNDRVRNWALIVPASGALISLMQENEVSFGSKIYRFVFTTPYFREIAAFLMSRKFTTEESILNFFKGLNERDFQEVNNSPFKNISLPSILRSLHWSSLGWAQGISMTNPVDQFNFDLTEISKSERKVHIYTAQNDTTAPARNGDWYKSKIPNAVLTQTPGIGHFGWMSVERLNGAVSKLIEN